MKTMTRMTKNDLKNAVEVCKVKIGKYWSYYVDRLQSGEFGVSNEDEPLFKFNTEGEAVRYAETSAAEIQRESATLNFTTA